MKKPHRRVLAIFSFNLLVFFLARIGLFLVYFQDFHDLTLFEALRAFARGLMFDASIIVLVTGLPLLMMLVPFVFVHHPHRLRLSNWLKGNAAVVAVVLALIMLGRHILTGNVASAFPYAMIALGVLAMLMLLPFRFTHHRAWMTFWTWVNFALLALFLFLLAADIIYFGFVHRHVGPEITAIGGDVGLMLDMAFGDYTWAIVLYLAACVGLFFLWRRLFRHADSEVGRFLPRIAVLLGALLGIAVLVRGGLGHKPLDIVDAFVASRPAAAYLSLNGPFAMSRALVNSRKINANFFPWKEAVALTQAQVLAPGERFVAGDDYPLVRARSTDSRHKPNVVVIMLESWDAIHNDMLRRDMGLQPYGVTPNFDALSRQGLLFTHFYANGERSMDGLASLVAGIPTLPGTAYIGMGMEQNRLAYLGHMAQQEGYDTIFMQSSMRASFHVDSIAAMAGFKTYLGAEDIPATGHSQNVTDRGAWDYDMLHKANQLFAAARKPFVGFLFTASTHSPFQSPGKQWTKYPPDSREHRFLNSLYYADWAIGRFFEEAKKAGYYDNTIFILTADHVSGFAGKANDAPSLHHTPLLILAPGLKPGVTTRIGGQIDVIPTIVQLAGWHAPLASLGHSLFDPDPKYVPGTLCVRGNIIERIEKNGWVTHDLLTRVSASPGTKEADLKAIENRMLAMYEVAHTLLLRNGIVPPDSQLARAIPATPGGSAGATVVENKAPSRKQR
jgi:phosphoglycerol transferase MdoB-like AlkP superfamily enzyme